MRGLASGSRLEKRITLEADRGMEDLLGYFLTEEIPAFVK